MVTDSKKQFDSTLSTRNTGSAIYLNIGTIVAIYRIEIYRIEIYRVHTATCCIYNSNMQLYIHISIEKTSNKHNTDPILHSNKAIVNSKIIPKLLTSTIFNLNNI